MLEKIKMILLNSFKNTWKTIKLLAKVVIPVILLITLIEMTGILEKISNIFEPLMSIFNLPGEASLALLLGNFVNLYAAISVIESIEMTSSQITTISIMLLFSHSLILETSIIASIGVKRSTQLLIRITSMIMIGLALSFVIGGIYG